jgi:hypothetical protein
MKWGILVTVILIAGCTGLNDVSDKSDMKYLSTEIKKGNNWRFFYTGGYKLIEEYNLFSNITIDSIWVNKNDTMIFSVTRFDSGIICYSDTLDSINTQTIVCEKYGKKIICSDILLARLFSDRKYVEFDSANDPRQNYQQLRVCCIKTAVKFDGETYLAVDSIKTESMGWNPRRYNTSHSLFADKIGIVFDSTEVTAPGQFTKATLLRYNGIEFSYSLQK